MNVLPMLYNWYLVSKEETVYIIGNEHTEKGPTYKIINQKVERIDFIERIVSTTQGIYKLMTGEY